MKYDQVIKKTGLGVSICANMPILGGMLLFGFIL